jgi:DNA-binding response OmpR family regulator
MLDLEKPGHGPLPVDRGAALLHLGDEDLARVVSLLLRDAGFQVRRVPSVAELEKAASSIGVSLVLIAGGASTPGAHPLAGFTPAPDRQYRVVALVGGTGTAALEAGADQIIQLPFDPKTFTQEVTKSLP